MWEKLPVPSDDPSLSSDTATGETIRILQRPQESEIHEKLDFLLSKGVKSIAVAFLHSYLWGEHENMVAKIAKEKGFQVSVSSELQPMVSGLS
jgi:5-oxoprolinase (ATP-hydrolysing)